MEQSKVKELQVELEELKKSSTSNDNREPDSDKKPGRKSARIAARVKTEQSVSVKARIHETFSSLVQIVLYDIGRGFTAPNRLFT